MDSIDVDNGMIRDRSGYDNHGSIQGPTVGESGVINESFRWNANGDAIVIGKQNALDVTDEVTISIWVNLSSGRESNNNLSHHFYSADYGLIQDNFFVRDPEAENREGINPQIPVDSSWHHTAMTFDGNQVVAYIDGVSTGSHQYNGSIDSSSGTLKIGNASGNNYTTDGNLDDVRLYNRALSEKEIKALYNIRSRRSYGSPYVPPAIPDRAIYHFGGVNSTPAGTDTILKYDAAADTISTQSATLPQTLSGASTATVGGEVFTFGGFTNGVRTDDVFIYDPSTDTISATGDKLPVNLEATSAAAVDGKAYIFGGIDSNDNLHDSIFEYDPSTNTISTQSATLPTALRFASATTA